MKCERSEHAVKFRDLFSKQDITVILQTPHNFAMRAAMNVFLERQHDLSLKGVGIALAFGWW